jgi:CheY-like chemotaxis protein
MDTRIPGAEGADSMRAPIARHSRPNGRRRPNPHSWRAIYPSAAIPFTSATRQDEVVAQGFRPRDDRLLVRSDARQLELGQTECRSRGGANRLGGDSTGIWEWPARPLLCHALAARKVAQPGVAMSGWAGLDFLGVLGRVGARRRSRHDKRIHDRRILYVDAELSMRIAVGRLLRSAGAVCIGTATHDQAAVLLAFEPTLDIAILDLDMPDGDVGRLVKRLHWQRPALPLVGTSWSDERFEFAARGVDRFLPKPWALDDLIRVADWRECPKG